MFTFAKQLILFVNIKSFFYKIEFLHLQYNMKMNYFFSLPSITPDPMDSRKLTEQCADRLVDRGIHAVQTAVVLYNYPWPCKIG